MTSIILHGYWKVVDYSHMFLSYKLNNGEWEVIEPQAILNSHYTSERFTLTHKYFYLLCEGYINHKASLEFLVSVSDWLSNSINYWTLNKYNKFESLQNQFQYDNSSHMGKDCIGCAVVTRVEKVENDAHKLMDIQWYGKKRFVHNTESKQNQRDILQWRNYLLWKLEADTTFNLVR